MERRHQTDRDTEVAVGVVGRVDAVIEDEVVSVARVVRGRGPVTTLVAGVVQVAIVEVSAITKSYIGK